MVFTSDYFHSSITSKFTKTFLWRRKEKYFRRLNFLTRPPPTKPEQSHRLSGGTSHWRVDVWQKQSFWILALYACSSDRAPFERKRNCCHIIFGWYLTFDSLHSFGSKLSQMHPSGWIWKQVKKCVFGQACLSGCLGLDVELPFLLFFSIHIVKKYYPHPTTNTLWPLLTVHLDRHQKGQSILTNRRKETSTETNTQARKLRVLSGLNPNLGSAWTQILAAHLSLHGETFEQETPSCEGRPLIGDLRLNYSDSVVTITQTVIHTLWNPDGHYLVSPPQFIRGRKKSPPGQPAVDEASTYFSEKCGGDL